jgi:hypothetical protein
MDPNPTIWEEILSPEVIAAVIGAGTLVAGVVWRVVVKRLRARAAATETPVDDLIVDAVDAVFQRRK